MLMTSNAQCIGMQWVDHVTLDYAVVGIMLDYNVGGVMLDYAVGGVMLDYNVGGVMLDYAVVGVMLDYNVVGVMLDYAVGGVMLDYNVGGVMLVYAVVGVSTTIPEDWLMVNICPYFPCPNITKLDVCVGPVQIQLFADVEVTKACTLNIYVNCCDGSLRCTK